MKTVVIKLLLFVGLFFAADFALGRVIGHFYATSENINLRDVNYGFTEKNKDDILIFGASELSHALISSQIADRTGLSTYNLACDGCGIYYQYPLLETILDEHAPKAIIISSNQMNDVDLRYLSRLYPIYGKNGHVRKIVDRLFPEERYKLAFQGYVYNSKILRVFDSKDDNLMGYVPLPPEESKTEVTLVDSLVAGKPSQISDESRGYFLKFVKEATAAGTKVYVCLPPVLLKSDESHRSNVLSIIEASGATVIDFSKQDDILEDRRLFFDKTHLNHNGAKVVTDRVLQVLKEDGVY